jgi:hypothetical protein
LRARRGYGAGLFLTEARFTMLRIALIDIFMFSLPFLIYGAYMIAAKGAAPGEVWQGAPILWLIAAGCGLLLITMAAVIQFSGGKPGGTYHPPSFQDGVIKPGTID